MKAIAEFCTKVPGLIVKSIGEQADWEAGEKRKNLHIQRG